MALHLLTADGSEYGGLKITPRGHAFLKEKESLHLRKFTGKAKVTVSQRGGSPLVLENEADQTLFAALKAARLELARAQNVPPYVIFHDRTLLELVRHRPASLAQMSGISGIGQTKLERYGEIFLEVISRHGLRDSLK